MIKGIIKRISSQFNKDNKMNDQEKEQNRWKNNILTHLSTKHIGQWTPEQEIEKHFTNSIPSYHVGQILNKMKEDKYLDYSRNMSQYLITTEGRKFIHEGGYKF